VNIPMLRKKNEIVGPIGFFSYYDGLEPVTPEVAAVSVEHIAELWPEFNKAQLEYIGHIFIQDEWPISKILDAINYYFKTQKYNPRPSDLLRYDKEIELFTWHQKIELGDVGFKCVWIPGHPNMVKKSDSIEGESIDAGWYVKTNIDIPESWSYSRI
jgi:hypothetical protein